MLFHFFLTEDENLFIHNISSNFQVSFQYENTLEGINNIANLCETVKTRRTCQKDSFQKQITISSTTFPFPPKTNPHSLLTEFVYKK